MIISLDLKHLLFSFFIRIGFKFNIKLSLAKIVILAYITYLELLLVVIFIYNIVVLYFITDFL